MPIAHWTPWPTLLAQAQSLWTTPLLFWQVLSIVICAAGLATVIILVRTPHAKKSGERSFDRSVVDASELDARISELRSLMADADELAHLLGTRLSEQAAHLEALLDRAESRSSRVIAPTREPRHLGERSESAPTPTDSLAARIFELADQGVRPAEIARRVGQHAGKVELMLALRGRDQSRPARPGSTSA
jgi:hypothetical protein